MFDLTLLVIFYLLLDSKFKFYVQNILEEWVSIQMEGKQ